MDAIVDIIDQVEVEVVDDAILLDVRGIIEMIKNVQAGCKIAVDDLQRLGDDHPRLPSLVVDRYTVGTCFFNPDTYRDGEVYKLVLAKSFLRRTDIDLGILETNFREWHNVAFPGGQMHFAGRHRDNPYIDAYHRRGNFFVECLFVIEVIQRFTSGDQNNPNDGLGGIALLLQARRDLMVNDNQLPFSVLESLYNLAFPAEVQADNNIFLRLSITFFSQCMLITDIGQALHIIEQPREERRIRDFIDLVRKCHAPIFERQLPNPPIDPIRFTAVRKVTHLEEAGMVIRPPSIQTSVCNLNYTRGTLRIPKLKVTHKSVHLLRNLMEYEIRHYPQETFIIDYLHFMGSLIDTARDVDLLINNHILDNLLPTSKGVANLFNSITEEAPLLTHNYYYHGLSAAVNAYCQIPSHRWKATLRRDYCSSPWMVASTIAAIILLVLTLIQTLCAIKSSF